MIVSLLEQCGILPIINTDDPSAAAPLAKAMVRAGMPICEVVFRSPRAPQVLSILKETCPELTVGAGTVIFPEQVDLAASCGAAFTVSPGIDAEIVRLSLEKGLLPLPGVGTASEVQLACRLGLKAVKFFPAGILGGLAAIRALAAPFPQIRYVPTNGVNMSNVEEYSAEFQVLACGGVFPTPPDLICAGDWDGISRLCEQALRLAEKGRGR